ncbi:hypothetical protein AVEN_222102-1 [Araneus ventricosus]|uniref:MBD domain-containing protein n=1 Tax=Araneus ventricosus TaxID=182803 RepID=A0A4Y2DWM7_ARAVE|nr:hypothetical protein AVEN_222102-1 [Araneus ventricosus]
MVEMGEITNMESSLGQNVIPCKSIDWVRKAVPRSDGSRTDIYYSIQGTNVILRSFNDVIGYCERNKIQCDKNLFNFSGKNTESGKVSDLLNLNEANLLEVRIPRTYEEAIKAHEASEWEEAMNRELKVMYERNVWELLTPPKDAKILGHDAASVRLQSNDGLLNNDEFLTFLDGSYVSAPEAMWRLNEFSLSEKSHVGNHEIGRSLAKPTASGKTKW